MAQPVSIPEIQILVNNLITSDQCLHADSKIEEYLNSIPQINFSSQKEKNEYSTNLYSIQEEVRKEKKKQANEERQKLKSALKEKREARLGMSTARPDNRTAPTSYAEAAKSSPAQVPQPQALGSIGEAFNQLKDPECVHMFQIIKKYIAISESNKSTSDKFTEMMTLLEIDSIA
ncbi:hypothetical protein NPIL_320571 [Nephila pilipes]|uniref:Uncharacterized protein n=1 Tax=Nephila pilipes TaxID=299642 RepID=A0A8X6R3Z8_NEPPI|nr:hypothetical protein NPIL_320571 [Nephila pilipes]